MRGGRLREVVAKGGSTVRRFEVILTPLLSRGVSCRCWLKDRN